MVSDRYLYWSIEMLPESRNSSSSTGSKQFAHRFLNISCSGRHVGELFFLFGKFKSCMKTYVYFKLEKNLSSEQLNMDKTYDLLSSPLKNDPLETTVSIFFFSKVRYSQPK